MRLGPYYDVDIACIGGRPNEDDEFSRRIRADGTPGHPTTGGQRVRLSILRELDRRVGRRVSRGALYKTLERLANKDLLDWDVEAATPDRGGHPRRKFEVTKQGVEAVRASREALFRGTVQPYDARRTFSHWLEEAAITRTRIKMYMGHAAKDVTDLYLRDELAAYLESDADLLRAYLGMERKGLELAK